MVHAMVSPAHHHGNTDRRMSEDCTADGLTQKDCQLSWDLLKHLGFRL